MINLMVLEKPTNLSIMLLVVPIQESIISTYQKKIGERERNMFCSI